MKKWIRHTELSGSRGAERIEIWEQTQDGKSLSSFPMTVTLGKPLDVLGLKNTSLDDVINYAGFLQKTADTLYAPDHKFTEMKSCPCCDLRTDNIIFEFEIFGIPYYRCAQCDHVFVIKQPKNEDLNQQFEDSEEHSAPYVDVATLEIRLEQVIRPKVEWACKTFQNYYGIGLKSGLDVGAGGGHFVEGLRRSGAKADGFELSRASREFAKKSFGVELQNDDFLAADPNRGMYDLITFWGLLEYTPQPKRFLQAARNWLAKNSGMLVVEVPRFDSLSTAIQKEFPKTVARHLDPTSHVNCFSDSSLTTALYESGFQPIAAWYFGMDAYETLIQLSIHSHPDLIEKLAHLIPSIQSGLDRVQFCDDLIVAAVPMKG
jgi:2-polyprenyl-3-methyl-5-hydroxy-6-metoxy-1,4-benzoquinol methylase